MPENKIFPTQSMLNHLRRLQHQMRADVPAEYAKKALRTFTAQSDTVPDDAPPEPVRVIVYPQDPFVGEPEIREMDPRDIRPGLRNARVRSVSDNPVQPDENGDYMYWPGVPQFDEVNAFYYTTFTLRMFERYAARALPWAFAAPQLLVDARAGRGANAYYNETTRMLGFFSFEVNGETVNTAQSADVVSHEAAHAVLDGLRDLYNESFGLGTAAFHESFGDMTAVLVALHDDSLVRRLLDWTQGDLHTDNFITKVAEQLTESAMVVYSGNAEHIEDHTVYLRNALNKFRRMPFDDLPYLPDDPAFNLGRESHNYSRLFTGAFYDLLVTLYDYHRESSPPRIAIHRARDLVGILLTTAIEIGPVGEMNFADMARAILSADMLLHDGQHTQYINEAFAARGILSRADANTHSAAQRALPEIIMPPDVDSALEAGIYLAEVLAPALGLPDEMFTPMAAIKNRRGHRVLTFFTSRALTLSGPEFDRYDGATIDVFGGLTLAFDDTGQLRTSVYRPVSDEDIRQIKIMTAELIRYGLVTDNLRTLDGVHDADIPVPEVVPELLYLPTLNLPGSDEPAKLVRTPMIFDSVTKPLHELGAYLRGWQKR